MVQVEVLACIVFLTWNAPLLWCPCQGCVEGTWLGGSVVIYIYICICMLGQIFKALLELVFSFFGYNNMLWWAQLPPFDRCCTVHHQYRLYLYYEHVSLCSEDGHYFSTQFVFWRSVIPIQRQNMETYLTLLLHY